MLINLDAIHRPQTIEEAAALVRRNGVYPIYGSGAYLVRLDLRDVQGAVDLGRAVNDRVGVSAGAPWIGGCATLETIAGADAQLGALVRDDAPVTLRHTLTLGDVLMEAPPDSLLLAALVGLDAQIVTPDRDRLPVGNWLALDLAARHNRIVERVELPRYALVAASGRRALSIALEKVGRTPADAPIVAALGFAETQRPDAPAFAIVVGVDRAPVRYQDGLRSARSDYKGSAEYRSAMARTLAEAAMARALDIARRAEP
ncbi:MAG: FAD binding domain-containing protein [Anaerolineae bacterium]|nr:FAD binding domain-containing protein [Anaerolineae bacterium]